MVLSDPAEVADGESRLDAHRAALERAGLGDLAALGPLSLSGAVIAEPRIVTAAPGAAPPLAPQPLSAFVAAGNRLSAGFLQAGLPEGTQARQIDVDVAYFVASSLTLADDTVVVVRQPHKHVVFIALDITVGANVSITYELPLRPAPQPNVPPGDVPATPHQVATPGHLGGVAGAPGVHGVHGGHGFAGVDAPQVELWTLQLSGSPRFLLRGQDGSPGGRGQDGGRGGQGSQGRDEDVDWILGIKKCKKGAGAGGDGGPGGNGGNGGSGGAGGDGGRLSVYAPPDVLLTYTSAGFTVNISAGRGGQAGEPGFPGQGGDGGRLGRNQHCSMSSGQRFDGKGGASGAGGHSGTIGPDGVEHDRPVRLIPIAREALERELTKPALVKAEPDRGTAGIEVSLQTLRLLPDDVLLFDGVPTPMQVDGPGTASFRVPPAAGGPRVVQAQQSDGTLSNLLTFYVVPTVSEVGPGPRIRPGSTATVRGAGFSVGARVRVNGEDMPDSVFVDATTMTFNLRPPRPVSPGDTVSTTATCEVLLEDGVASNPLIFTIDTLRLLVIGDSVAWGQGLRDDEKYAELVEGLLANQWPGIARETTFLAHSGAIIGAGDNTVQPSLPGEIPTSYPTAMQQLADYRGDTATVDVVLITAGLNDVNFRTVIDPTTSEATLTRRIDQACRSALKDLLIRTARLLPDSLIVATGYYPILSDQSADGLAEPFLVAAGLAVGGPVGAALSTAAWARVLEHCRLFHELSTVAIARAVDEANRELSAPRVLFADPGFAPSNAALASDSWLYGIDIDLTPQDTWTYGDRAATCSAHAERVDVFQCERASVGHPNPRGAAAYAAAITRELALGPTPPMDVASAQALLQRFAPVLVLHPEESNRPTTVGALLPLCALRFHHDGGCDDCEVLPVGRVHPQSLVEATHRSKNALCNHVDDDRFRSTEMRSVFRDEGFFLQPSEATRDRARAGLEDPSHWVFYGRIMPRNATLGRMFGPRAVALQYWFLYGYNESTRWGPGQGLIHQSHEGDWEHVTAIIENDQIVAVWFASHASGIWARPGDGLETEGEHPVVYSAQGTHGSYPNAGNQSRPDPLPDDHTGHGIRSAPVVTVEVLREVSDGPENQEWLAYAGLWGEIGNLATSSGPPGPAFQSAWYSH